MQSRSSAWETLAAGGYFLLETKAVIGGTDYTQISSPVIKRGLFQDRLSVGNCSAASLQLSIKIDDTIPRSAEIKIYQRLLSEPGGTPTEWLPAGSFFVASRSRDYASGITPLQCYDAMLKAREDYFPDGVITGTWPKTMTAVVAEIAQKMGVSVDSRTTIRTEERYRVYVPEGYTLMDVLGFIGAVHGGNWIITEEGKLRLVPLVDAPTSESMDAYAITAVLGSLQSGKTMTISRVTMTSGEGEEAVTYTAGDDTGYELVVGNNPYATQDICDDLLDTLGGLVYAPFSASNAICDPAMELGDKITYGDTLYSIIVQEDRTLGVAYRNTISAPADEEIEDEYPYISGAAKESQKLQKGIDDARKVANNYLSADSTGVMVADMTDGTAETPSGIQSGKNVLITAGYTEGEGTAEEETIPAGVRIRDGQDVLASFGEEMQIGKDESGHVVIKANETVFYGRGYQSGTTAEAVFERGKIRSGAASTSLYTNEIFDTEDISSINTSETITTTLTYTPVAVSGTDLLTIVIESSAFSSTQTFVFNAAGTQSFSGTGVIGTITYDGAKNVILEFTTATAEDENFICTANYYRNIYSAAYSFGKNAAISGDCPMAVGFNNSATGDSAFASGRYTTASGVSAHTEGYNTTASGRNSHSEGYNTIASSKQSHAEGYATKAQNTQAHAEGYETVASGWNSHAEGKGTTASGEMSHAEGFATTASGKKSHAEGGRTKAIGLYSHAEGLGTEAQIAYSHAQNNMTIASRRSQTVIGDYNKADTYGVATGRGLYALIIGNGSNTNNVVTRSNALTVLWDGNVYMALDTAASSGTTDADLYDAITALGWANDVIV